LISRSLLTTWPLIQSKLRSYLKRIKGNLEKNKGSFKDPLLYLGTFSVILFSIVSLGANSIFKTVLHQEDFSFLARGFETSDQSRNQFVFIPPKTKLPMLDLNIIQKNSLKGASPPDTVSFQTLGSLVNDTESLLDENISQANLGSKEIVEYIVQTGDTLSLISEKFGISIETILWANDLNKSSAIQPGQKLIILPVSGVLYYVKKDDTLSEIAKTYKAETSEIISFNELSSEGDIYIGDILIIPNGVKPQPAPLILPQVPLASSYFIVPVSSPYIITQRLHWPNAIDFSHAGTACGKPIYAAAGGQILRVKYGWNVGAGNYLTILHPNGVVTMYGHLQSVLVNQGDIVLQGQMIALIGGKPGMPGAGNSTGCHLHFGVQGAKNPFGQ